MEPGEGFPVRTRQYTKDVQGTPTDFLFSVYEDRLLLFVNQLGTAGTIITATQDSTFDGSTTFSTTVLMGRRDEPLLPLCARRIVEGAHAKGYTKTMLICLALKEHSQVCIKDVVRCVDENNPWNPKTPS